MGQEVSVFTDDQGSHSLHAPSGIALCSTPLHACLVSGPGRAAHPCSASNSYIRCLCRPLLQSILLGMGDWVTAMSFAASTRVGDFGALYAADAKGESPQRASPDKSTALCYCAPGSLDWCSCCTNHPGGHQLAFHDKTQENTCRVAANTILT